MRWWLDRGVDGFRMDVINLISKRLPLRDGVARQGARFGDGSPDYICGPRIHEFLQEMHRDVFAGRPRDRPTQDAVSLRMIVASPQTPGES